MHGKRFADSAAATPRTPAAIVYVAHLTVASIAFNELKPSERHALEGGLPRVAASRTTRSTHLCCRYARASRDDRATLAIWGADHVRGRIVRRNSPLAVQAALAFSAFRLGLSPGRDRRSQAYYDPRALWPCCVSGLPAFAHTAAGSSRLNTSRVPVPADMSHVSFLPPFSTRRHGARLSPHRDEALPRSSPRPGPRRWLFILAWGDRRGTPATP